MWKNRISPIPPGSPGNWFAPWGLWASEVENHLIRRRWAACLILFLVFSATPEYSRANSGPTTMEPAGYGGGGRFTAVAQSPFDSKTLLVGSDVAGVFKSVDRGKHFHISGSGLENFAVADIAFSPTISGRVYLLTDGGFYCSGDNGDHWQKLGTTVAYPARFFGNRLLRHHDGHLWVATAAKGIFRFDPTRDTFTPVPGLENMKTNSLAVFHGHLCAATETGVYRYEGNRWRPFNRGLPEQARHIMEIADAREKAIFLVEKNTGLYAWHPERQRWAARPVARGPSKAPRGYKALAVDPSHPRTLYLATHPESWPYRIFKSINGGKSWQSNRRFILAPDAPTNWATNVDSIEEILFLNDGELLLADWWNLWRSGDGGRIWRQMHRGLQNTVVNDIAFHPSKPNEIYLAVADNGLMVSRNRGATWHRRMAGIPGGHAREIEVSRTDPSRMYLLLNPWEMTNRFHLYKSGDGGATWRAVGPKKPNRPGPGPGYVSGLATNIAIDPENDDVVYLAANGYGVFRTENGGRDWLPANTGLPSRAVSGPDALVIHPRHPDTLYVSTLNGGVYTSRDRGRNWHPLATRERFTFGMAIDPSAPEHMVVACAGKKVQSTRDGGRTWHTVPLPGPKNPNIAAHAVAIHPNRPGLVLVGTLAYDYGASAGLFMSRDGGQSFEPCPSQLPRVSIQAISFHPHLHREAFIGYNGIGVFKALIEDGSK